MVQIRKIKKIQMAIILKPTSKSKPISTMEKMITGSSILEKEQHSSGLLCRFPFSKGKRQVSPHLNFDISRVLRVQSTYGTEFDI
jgi:hypothetical protein